MGSLHMRLLGLSFAFQVSLFCNFSVQKLILKQIYQLFLYAFQVFHLRADFLSLKLLEERLQLYKKRGHNILYILDCV